MLFVYKILISVVFLFFGPFCLLFAFITGVHRHLLYQRLGLYRSLPPKGVNQPRFWLHGASVGEVQAIKVMIKELSRLLPQAQFVVTTMTVHGKAVAEKQLGDDIHCLLTPLDVPMIVHRVVSAIDPDVYICIETELWPVLLHSISTRDIASYLVNGRMSKKSCRNYLKGKSFFSRVINTFDHMAFITDDDRSRFVSLGGDERKMSVDGNVKYDLPAPESLKEVEKLYGDILAVDEGLDVLIGGSTRHGEEEMLISLWEELERDKELLLILAPRHLERLPEIEHLLSSKSFGFHRFSDLKSGLRRRYHCVLLDTLGELYSLYGLGTFIFCGGSLVDCGGHNIMEPAAWNKVVFFGPHMEDFADAVGLLEPAGGGITVQDIDQLGEKIRYFRTNRQQYDLACRYAGEVAASQRGSARRQAARIAERLL